MQVTAKGSSTAIQYVEPAVLGAVADWLGNIFLTPPDFLSVERFRMPEAAALLRELGDFFDCKDAASTMITIVNAHEASHIARVLQRCYTELFEGVSGPRTVLLYESAYHGNGHRLFQQPLAEMQVTLQRLDLSVRVDCPEPADHLAIELAALGCAIRQGQFDDAETLARRLESWTPALAARLETRDLVGFYTAATQLLTAYLAVLQPMALATASGERVVIQ